MSFKKEDIVYFKLMDECIIVITDDLHYLPCGSFTSASDLTATTVQAAIDELEDRIDTSEGALQSDNGYQEAVELQKDRVKAAMTNKTPNVNLSNSKPLWTSKAPSDWNIDPNNKNNQFTEEIDYYPFETYVRPYDGTIVEAITGIPAEEYAKIKNFSDGKMNDDI